MYARLVIVYIVINEIVLGHLLKPTSKIVPDVNYNKDIQAQLEDKVEAAMRSVNSYKENKLLDDDMLITGEISAMLPKKNYESKFTKHMKESAKQQENILRAIENLYKEFQEEHVHKEPVTRAPITMTLAPQTPPVYVGTNHLLPGNTQPQYPAYYNQYYQPNEYQQHISGDTRRYSSVQASSNVMENNQNNMYPPCASPYSPSPPSPPGTPGPLGPKGPPPCPLTQLPGYMYPPSFPQAPAFPPAPMFPLTSAFPPPPIVLPGRMYFEPVSHNHPPLGKINEYIKKETKDFKKWKKYRNKYKQFPDTSSGSDSSSSDSDRSMTFDYYDDAIVVSRH